MSSLPLRQRGRPAMSESENPAPPQRAESVDALIGKVLNGRFKVLERIGSGGMGRVYKALQSPLDRMVALKVLNPNYAVDQDPAFAKRFFLEASVSSKLTHPNSITIFDYGRTDDGIFFIAMEYLQGRTLHQSIAAEGCLVAPRVVHIARQICRALREAHGLGIVHRDLKPANVMLLHHGDDEDFVKVLDFGLVKFFTDDANPLPEEGELTQGGVFLGSPTYMAPEQARNEADPRSDIYSLGVVMFHMLAGHPPFSGRAPVDVILKHVNEAPPPFRPELKVPPDLDAVLRRALAKNPDERYQSMDELLEALKRLGTLSPSDLMLTSSIPAGPDKPPPPTSRPPSRGGRPTTSPMPGVARPSAPHTPFHLPDDEEVTDPESRPLRGPLLGLAGLVGAVAVGALLVLLFNRPPPPAPIKVSVPAQQPTPAPIPTPPPVERSLHVESVPAGASVRWNGRLLGVTPLDVRIDPGDTFPELALSADGYAPTTVQATREGDGMVARATLEKLPPPPVIVQPSAVRPIHKKKSAPSSNASGYKDDPYK